MTTTQDTTNCSLIGGEWTDGSGETMVVRSAWSDRTIAEISMCSAADVSRAVHTAKTAQPGWADLAPGRAS